MLWNGVSYIDGSAITSDRDFYYDFHTTFSSILRNKSRFNQTIIHDLIITCHLKAMLRTQHQLDFRKMENWLRNNYSKLVKPNTAAFRGMKRTAKRKFSGNSLVLGTGRAVVKNGVSVSAGFRVPFASRLLFFSCPQLLIFNFSNPLAVKSMHFQARPHIAYTFYSAAMLDGLRRNWSNLSSFNVPFNSQFKEPIIDKLRKTDWWARRVLDIALLIRFGIFSVSHSVLRLSRLQRFSDQSTMSCKCP